MKALKRKFRRFMSDDNGMEFIQVAVIILAAIALAGAAYVMYTHVADALKKTPVSIPSAPGMGG